MVVKLLVTLESDAEIDVEDYRNAIIDACVLDLELRPDPLKTKLNVTVDDVTNG